MRKVIVRLSIVMVVVLSVFASCTKDEYEEELLYGTWTCTDLDTYTFNSDHSGKTEYFQFTWNLDGDELEIRHSGSGEGAGSVAGYETFIITSLSDKVMECYDANDKSSSYTFRKK